MLLDSNIYLANYYITNTTMQPLLHGIVDIKLPVLQPTAIRPTTNFNSMLPQLLFQCVVYHEHMQ